MKAIDGIKWEREQLDICRKELVRLQRRISDLERALGELGYDWCQQHCDGDDHTNSCMKAHRVWEESD